MRKKYETRPSDIVSDVVRLLDAAGIDGVQRRSLDDMIHSGVKAQAIVDFADDMHRRMGCRVGYSEFVSEFVSEFCGMERAA